MAMAVANGSSGFPYFSESTYAYLCDVPLAMIDVKNDEVPVYEVRTLLEKVLSILIITNLCSVNVDSIHMYMYIYGVFQLIKFLMYGFLF